MKVAAADLGATSGRVVVAELTSRGPELTEVARFRNGAELVDGRWTWPMQDLYQRVIGGVAAARDLGARSWGIDTWGVDFGIVRLDRPLGTTVGPVLSHRDPVHESGVDVVRELVPWEEHYGITGIQHLPFNTVYQLAAGAAARITDGTALLMLPDLIGYWATGVAASDVTDASTTGLVDPRTRQWSPRLLAALGLPESAFLPLREPGRIVGPAVDPAIQGLPLVGVGTHDTASAFAGAPIADPASALVLSLGTWALVGVEGADAEPTDAARGLNLTHELGVDGTVRLLHNVAGMWLLEECRRTWAAEDGAEPDVPSLVDAALSGPAFGAVFDVDIDALQHPGQSPATIAPHLVTSMSREDWLADRGSIVRTILESLVLRLAMRVRTIEDHLGTPRAVLHVVGGATRIPALMQWLADATGKTVVAGPVEATAIGNALVQWQALGAVADLAEGRALVRGMAGIRTYLPASDASAWQAAASRLEGR